MENDKFRIISKLVENHDGERRQDVIPIETICHSRGSGNPEKETKIFASRLDSCFCRNDQKT
jgi:hypothetical protein